MFPDQCADATSQTLIRQPNETDMLLPVDPIHAQISYTAYLGSRSSSNPEIVPKASTDAKYIPTNHSSLLLSFGSPSVVVRTRLHLSSKHPISEQIIGQNNRDQHDGSGQ
jgi:hypothetical protein